MILWKSKEVLDDSINPYFFSRRKILQVGLFFIGLYLQCKVKETGKWFLASYDLEFIINTNCRFGFNHFWYDGPHCSLSFGFLHINWRGKHCNKCIEDL